MNPRAPRNQHTRSLLLHYSNKKYLYQFACNRSLLSKTVGEIQSIAVLIMHIQHSVDLNFELNLEFLFFLLFNLYLTICSAGHLVYFFNLIAKYKI